MSRRLMGLVSLIGVVALVACGDSAEIPATGSAMSADPSSLADRSAGAVVRRRNVSRLRGGDGGPIVESGLFEDAMDVVLDGREGQLHAAGDLLVAEAVGDEDDGLAFAG